MSMDNNSAFEQFFTDGNLSNFTDPDRNWFTQNPNAPNRHAYDYTPGSSHVKDQGDASHNWDGSLSTYKNEIPKLEEYIAKDSAQTGSLEVGNRLKLWGMKGGHAIQDLFGGLF